MTDKELRKLSRLELLEMLLEVSKENEKLKKTLEEIKVENRAAKSAESLSATVLQMNTALEYINSLADVLRRTSQEMPTVKADGTESVQKSEVTPPKKQSSVSDLKLYCRILAFYAGNSDALDILPKDISIDIRSRIKSILVDKKSN